MAHLSPDVMLSIIACCSQRDVCNLMQTCRFFYEEGPRVLLRQTVHLETSIQLSGFLAFLRLQDGSRLAFVRSFRFELSDWNDNGAAEIFTYLPLMSNLRSLHFSHGEHLFQREPEVVDIIAELTSLQELTVHHAGFETARLLRSLQSELVCVDIDFNDLDDYPFFQTIREEQYPRLHPVRALSHSMATLTKLVCRQWYTHSKIVPDTRLVYPNLGELEIYDGGLPLVFPFIHAFPNLRHLAHRARPESRGHPLSAIEAFNLSEEYAAQRTLNVSQQISLGRTWERLCSFSGDLAGLYVLGLTCPIERVTLHLGCEDQPAMLGPSLSTARPRNLEVCGFEGYARTNGDLSKWREGLKAVFSGEGGSRLERFSGMSGIPLGGEIAQESDLSWP